jgi:SAM-dependent methyltransferase
MANKILDLGCGTRKRAGAVGIDNNPKTAADVIHDLNSFPYPFEASGFDEIYADNVLEHLDDPIKVMEEIYRIGKLGALIRIDVPYFRARWAYIDPTHSHFFTVDSFSYFDPTHVHNKLFPYSEARFRVERVVFNEKIKTRGLMGLIKRLANLKPSLYEKRLGHLLPLDELTFFLRIIK